MTVGTLLILALMGLASAMPQPANFGKVECAVNSFAYLRATQLIPQSRQHFVSDALNLAQICPGNIDEDMLTMLRSLQKTLTPYRVHESSTEAQVKARSGAGPTFFVATNGTDQNSGTINSPFRTLHRAQAATRASSCTPLAPCVVNVRAGKYYLGDTGGTLALGTSDNNVIYTNYLEEEVTLSGATHLQNLLWSPYSKVQGAFVTPVTIHDARVKEWREKHNEKNKAGPPPLVGDLFVNGVRQVRARYPNGNLQDNTGLCFSATQRPHEGCPGYTSCTLRSTGSFPAPPGHTINNIGPNRGQSPTNGCPQCGQYGTFSYTIYPPPNNHPVYNKPLPSSGWPNSSVWDFWGSLFSRPSGVIVDGSCADWNKLNLSGATDGVVHMFHSGLWGGWAFAVDDIKSSNNQIEIDFGYGGYQEARGSDIDKGQHFYLENILGLLDVPGEWFYDGSHLYYYPNTTTPISNLDFSVPLLDSVITIQGKDAFQGTPAMNIIVRGFTITETKYTYLEQYEVPSGGDWSIHRGGAIFVENAEGITISQNFFDQTGGNAVFLSNHVKGSIISDNEFTLLGDSAIVLQGSAVLNDGSQPIYPEYNVVTQNHVHEYGLYGKQTSCVFLSLVGHINITNNVCYNGPRAHINQNDGFVGGNLISGNVLFNAVRETGDHGNYNSWDRQPYWTFSGVDDGFHDAKGRSYIKAMDNIYKNLIVNGYNGVWTIDHDDGSQFFLDSYNALYFGGCKNYLGHSKSCNFNVITYPGVDGRSAWGHPCQTDDNGVFANQYHLNNVCYSSDGSFYSFTNCNKHNSLNQTVYVTGKNKLYSDNTAHFNLGCPDSTSFSEWQALGQDFGSSNLVTPSLQEIIAQGKAVLGL